MRDGDDEGHAEHESGDCAGWTHARCIGRMGGQPVVRSSVQDATVEVGQDRQVYAQVEPRATALEVLVELPAHRIDWSR